MTFLVVASTTDIAAKNVASELIERYRFERTNLLPGQAEVYKRNDILLAYVDVDSIHADRVDKLFDVEGVVFASRHRSERGEPTLTVHVSGNPTSEAPYGGRPRELAWAWPERMRNALRKLVEAKDELSVDYRVSLEATHHGPTELSIPVWFVEIGGSERYWGDDEAGLAVAEAIWASLTQPLRGERSVGFGGGHYSPKHTRLCVEEDYAVGHIFSKHVLGVVEQRVIAEAFAKTVGRCEVAVIDWKGMTGPQRGHLMGMLKALGVGEIIKT